MNTIVIIARNGLHLTRRTLKAALAQDVPVEIILVDNQSSDGTLHWALAVEAQIKDVRVITLAKQLSLAACWNLALRKVWERGGEHALVLNNDVLIQPPTYKILESTGWDFVTTVSVDNEEQFQFPRALDMYGRPHPNFSGFLIRKECFDKVGPFNDSYYPAYCEDAEYHVRMHRAGVRAVCIDLPMLHIGNGANTLRFADPAEANLIKRGADRNRDKFLEKYGCKPGEPAYDALFSDATFGIDRGVA